MRHACQDSNFTIMIDAYFFSLSHIFLKQISLGVDCYIGLNDDLGILPCTKCIHSYYTVCFILNNFESVWTFIILRNLSNCHVRIFFLFQFTYVPLSFPQLGVTLIPSSLTKTLISCILLIRKRIAQLSNNHLNYLY